MVAAGQADGVISMWGKNEWDVAAGVLLVQEAGGRAMDRAFNPFRFNRRDPLLEGIVAGHEAVWPKLVGFLRNPADKPNNETHSGERKSS